MNSTLAIPPRILMTADAVGGVWTYAVDLIRALEDEGVEVILATMGPEPNAQQRREVEARGNATLEVSDFDLEWMVDPWSEVEAAGQWLLDLADRYMPDLVHLNGYAHGALPWGVPVLVVGHSCVLSWWKCVRGEEAPASWGRYREEVTRGLHAADRVLAPTHAMVATLDENYGPLPARGVIYNASFVEPLLPDVGDEVILSVGRLWDEAKNVGALAEVAHRVGWPIRVAGEDRHPEGGRRTLEGLHALGRLSRAELVREMTAAEIFVLPARYEPFGLSALEAASRGCALVLGDIPSLREVWGDAARYVPPDRPEEVAFVLNALIDDPGERRRLSVAAHQRARRYRPKRLAAEYLTLYGDLLRGGVRPPPHPGRDAVRRPVQVSHRGPRS